MKLVRSFSPFMGEEIYRGRAENGLRVFVQPRRGFERKYATFSARYGSVDNEFVPQGERDPIRVPDGIAHFLEHKLFEEDDGNVDARFSALGASCNAYTSFVKTTYLFSTVSRFDDCLRLLVDFVGHPHFTPENVQKEKGVIEQEIRMYQDSPEWRGFFGLLGALFPQHPVGIDIAGTDESIRSIDVKTLNLCYHSFYRPSNMVLHVLGDVDPHAVAELAEEQSQKSFPKAEEPVKRILPGAPPVKTRRVVQNLAVAVPLVNIGFRDDIQDSGHSLQKREILTNVILEAMLGEAAPLYNRLYEKGLINDTFGGDTSCELSFGFSRIGGESSEPERLIDELLEGIKKVGRSGLERDQFERARRKLLGQLFRGLNSFDYVSEQWVSWVFRDADFLDSLDLLRELTYEDALARVQGHFHVDKAAMSLILPPKGVS